MPQSGFSTQPYQVKLGSGKTAQRHLQTLLLGCLAHLQASAQDVEEVLVKLVRLLANIAISPDAGATLAASSAVVDPLLDMLGAKRISDSEDLVLNVVAAVTNLLFWDVPSNMLFQEESKQLLCRLFRPLLLESYNVEALVETARALGNLSRHADARKCMVSLRLDEILAILLDHDDRDLVCFDASASKLFSMANLEAGHLLSELSEGAEDFLSHEMGSQPEQRGRGLWLRVAAAAAGVLGVAAFTRQMALQAGSSHLSLHGAAGTIQLSGEDTTALRTVLLHGDFNGMGEKFAQAMKEQAGQAWGASAQANKQAAQQTVQSAFQGNLGHLAPHENLHDSNPCADDEEQFEGLCYSKCSILTGGMKPVRCAAHICEPLDSSGQSLA
eukprot:s88_g11.t2